MSHIHVYSQSGAFVIKHFLGRKIFIDNNEFPISILPLKILFTTTITTKYYNLVLIDKRTRYPVVEAVNKERLKHIFPIYGTPKIV